MATIEPSFARRHGQVFRGGIVKWIRPVQEYCGKILCYSLSILVGGFVVDSHTVLRFLPKRRAYSNEMDGKVVGRREGVTKGGIRVRGLSRNRDDRYAAICWVCIVIRLAYWRVACTATLFQSHQTSFLICLAGEVSNELVTMSGMPSFLA